jgi:hypothetical protein
VKLLSNLSLLLLRQNVLVVLDNCIKIFFKSQIQPLHRFHMRN